MQFHYSIVIKRKANVWFYSHVSFIIYMMLNIAVLKQLLRVDVLSNAGGNLFGLLHREDNGGRAVHYVAASYFVKSILSMTEIRLEAYCLDDA